MTSALQRSFKDPGALVRLHLAAVTAVYLVAVSGVTATAAAPDASQETLVNVVRLLVFVFAAAALVLAAAQALGRERRLVGRALIVLIIVSVVPAIVLALMDASALSVASTVVFAVMALGLAALWPRAGGAAVVAPGQKEALAKLTKSLRRSAIAAIIVYVVAIALLLLLIVASFS